MVRVTGRLAISRLQLRDSGDYKCGASNTAGAESAEVVQEVKVVRAEEVSNSRYCLFPNIFVGAKHFQVFIGKFQFEHGGHEIVQPRGLTETRWMFSVEAR